MVLLAARAMAAADASKPRPSRIERENSATALLKD
jgi:hypothetical protein